MKKLFLIERDMIHFAFRYALGRQTYAPSIVQEAIKTNIYLFEEEDVKRFIKEINECVDYGMEMDKLGWLELRDWLRQFIEQ